jgi:hypothetical protein
MGFTVCLQLAEPRAHHRHYSANSCEHCKYIDGDPDNIHRRFDRKSHPYRHRPPKKEWLSYDRPNRSIKKNAFVLLRFDPGLDKRNHLLLSFGVMLDISGGGAEIGMTGQHLDIAKGAARLADLPSRTGDESSAT